MENETETQVEREEKCSALEAIGLISFSPYIIPTVIRSVKNSEDKIKRMAAFITGMSGLAWSRLYAAYPPEYLLIPATTNALSLVYEAGRYTYNLIKKSGEK